MRELLEATSCGECEHSDVLCPEHRAQLVDLAGALAVGVAFTLLRLARRLLAR